MLHELLLALSGYPSPLLSLDGHSPKRELLFGQLTTPSERVLIKSLAHLGMLHASVRSRTTFIRESQRSAIVCRAVAAAIADLHLARFQETILNAERKILRRDAYFVGAYDNVPLSTIACAFDGWSPILEWLQDVATSIQGTKESPHRTTAAQLIERLRMDTKTGHPDLESAAIELVRVAEFAWLRQAASWMLYGRLPTLGRDEFFIQPAKGRSPGSPPVFEVRKDLLPTFVSAKAAVSALAVGRSMEYLGQRGLTAFSTESGGEGESLIAAHHRKLAALESPISAVNFQKTADAIRASISRTALQSVFPASKIALFMEVLQQFLLLGRDGFATALLTAAQSYAGRRPPPATHQRRPKGPEHLAEMEMSARGDSQILNKALATLLAADASLQAETDKVLEVARELLQLRGHAPSQSCDDSDSEHGAGRVLSSNVERLFQTPLLPSVSFLAVTVPSPLELFISTSDIGVYSVVHNYLLSIWSAHYQVSELWRFSDLRRVPSKAAAQVSGRANGAGGRGEKTSTQDLLPRRVWSTLSSVAFLTSELYDHFQGNIVAEYGQSVRQWATMVGSSSGPASDENDTTPMASQPSMAQELAFGDPAELAHVHTMGLETLLQTLLLNDAVFPVALHTLFAKCSHLQGMVGRLAELDRVARALSQDRTESEEQPLLKALDQAEVGAREALASVTQRLKEIDRDGLTLKSPERRRVANVSRSTSTVKDPDHVRSGGKASPPGGLEYLLARLDLSRFEDGKWGRTSAWR